MPQPMLDPERDLAGATPETLVRALFRRVEPLQPSAESKGKRRVHRAVSTETKQRK